MKFAHLADCHIGGWRDNKLNELSLEHFKRAVEICLEENVGFVLISGDLFDTALPGTDLMKEVAKELRRLRKKNMEVYIVAGSHDFSPSGKTVLDVYESAGLCINVNKYENDKLKFFEDKTGVKITGMPGRRGGLEKEDFKRLNKSNLEIEKGFKIFLFHTALEEFKPKELEEMEGINLMQLPKNFNYYAGGHVHYVFNTFKEGYGKIVFPGPLFPNNFKELEELKKGGFYIVDEKLNLIRKELEIKKVLSFKISGKSSKEINKEIEKLIEENEFEDKIATLRIEGELEEGKISEIKVRDFIKQIEEKGAFYVMKNLNKLSTKEFSEIKLEGEVKDIEKILIKKHLGQFKMENEEKLTQELMEVFNEEKLEGETNSIFEARMINLGVKSLKL